MFKEVASQFGIKVRTYAEVEDSHSSSVYKCLLESGETVFLKIPYTKLKYQRELEAYEILKGNIAVPEMLDYWSGNAACAGAFMLSELKGQPLTSEVSSTVAFQVGSLHASMHNVQPSDDRVLTGIKNESPNWSHFIEKQFYSYAEDVRKILDIQLYKKSINKFEEMKDLLPLPDGPSFIHMDFRPANIIIDGNHVSGVIDFESVRFGSTEIDFTKIYRDFLRFNPNLYEAYQGGYNIIRPLINLESVLPFYQIIDAFNSIGWCKRRGIEKNAVFLEENLIRLKNML